MRNGILRKLTLFTAAILVSGMAAGCGTAGSSAVPASTEPAEPQVFTENITGSADGYDYELWKDEGDTTFTVEPGGGTFSCEWTNINNALFRRGQKFDCTKTYQELGTLSVDFGVDYQPDGNSYMCVYGWTREPLIEFYIVESWGSWRPPGAPFAIGTVTVDGATYDIYKTTRVEQPSIDGTQTFDQYWSVRQEKPAGDGTKLEGTISVSKHFDAWKKCGLELGKMYEVALTIEGYQSQGKATVYKNELKISDTYEEATDIQVTVDEDAIKKLNDANADDSGSKDPVGFFETGFETGKEGWVTRGGPLLTIDKEHAAGGSQSLFVSGRTDYWNGATILLSSDTYKPGEAYHFKAKVMQESGKDATMKMTLQYNQGGEKYDEIALAPAKSGEWITLENLAYKIPDGAENLQLYVEITDSLTDFYVDDVSGAEKAAA
ncbi:MAG: glycoside hydrolase family 11 protein [Oscillospiraceae bacterium]|nr:glycoside hydrolase family 11 protein [Oscillospiraceae bacterium]